MDENDDQDIPCSSGDQDKMRSGTKKLNIWEQVDVEGEMDAPDVHQLNLQGVTVYDQQKLEEGMFNQFDQDFKQRQQDLEKKRAVKEIRRLETEIREIKTSIHRAERTLDYVLSQSNDKDVRKRLESIRCQKVNKEKQLKSSLAKLKSLQVVAGIVEPEISTVQDVEVVDMEQATSSAVSWALTGKDEEEREKLIKLGHMTPFGSIIEDTSKEPEKTQPQKRKLFLDDGFNDFLTSQQKPTKKVEKVKPKKLKPKILDKNFKIPKKKKSSGLKSWLESGDDDDTSTSISDSKPLKNAISENSSSSEKVINISDGSDTEYIPDQDEESRMELQDLEDEEELNSSISERKRTKQPRYNPENGLPIFDDNDVEDSILPSKKAKLQGSKKIVDDGKITNYRKRIELYRQQIAQDAAQGYDPPEDKDLGDGFKVPGRIWSKLYKYQKTGVRWLWELHSQKVGGILGDEMGLGKTIQIISFLAGVQQSGLRSRSVPGYPYEGLGPVLIITPTTVMHQWVKEFQTWWPPMRVAILHDSGTYESSRAQLVDNIAQTKGVLVTSYERARINVEMLLDHGWHYVILDEGHKIRNPDAAVTVALKLFRTPHRLILSGSPVQNNLKELWSLFDYIFPGKLGTLPVFMEQFSIPIVQGGYSNATEIQVHTAYKCASKLRDTISPYLLRRMKRDVQLSIELPSKNEQVLFCRLSEHQIDVYKRYLDSDAVHSILTREMKVFAGLIQLRKICNHPDLYTGGPKIMVGEATPSPHDERSFGYYKRSGKMLVVSSLLKIWKKQGHKVLLFTQSKAMLDIIEIFVSSRGYSYLVMHGGTQVQSRQPLVTKFNEDPSIFVFILTTRVGGLGVNLTGANRVVIYDPDWNPSTDSQAQERAWRIGQQKDVTIYRLLTSGTIEEKIYHRQIFKQFLTNRILKDPWQRRFFKSNDLHELFILKDYGDDTTNSKDGDKNECKTETAAIFAGTGSEVKPERKRKVHQRKSFDPPTDIRMKSKSTSKNTNHDNDAVSSNNDEMAKPESNDVKKASSNSLKESLMRAKQKFEEKRRSEEKTEKKGKKKRNKKKSVIDGEVVGNVASIQDYKPHKGADEEIEEKSKNATDDYVLHRLFKRAGVHSALQHNTIMDSAHPDYALVEVEAERVAKESVRNLRLSRRQYKFPTGKPNTSKPRFGKKTQKKVVEKDDSAVLKKENDKEKFKASHIKPDQDVSASESEEDSNKSDSPAPLSASQLLANMRRRNHEEIHKQEALDAAQQDEENELFGFSLSGPSVGGATSAENPTEHDEMMTDLRNFIAFQCEVDGEARTSEIMTEFGSKIQPSHAAVFKSILKELCTSEDLLHSNEKLWRLKPEFR